MLEVIDRPAGMGDGCSGRSRERVSERLIMAEHQRLDALFAEARAALEPCDAAVAQRALAGLAAALAVHFEQEDRLYYPPVASLRPVHAEQVRAFAAAHVRFLAQLAEVERRAREESVADARAAFESLALAFSAHEAAEEQLLRSLEAEFREAR
jgi:hypothetical protein